MSFLFKITLLHVTISFIYCNMWQCANLLSLPFFYLFHICFLGVAWYQAIYRVQKQIRDVNVANQIVQFLFFGRFGITPLKIIIRYWYLKYLDTYSRKILRITNNKETLSNVDNYVIITKNKWNLMVLIYWYWTNFYRKLMRKLVINSNFQTFCHIT